MSLLANPATSRQAFAASDEAFESVKAMLSSQQAREVTHEVLEAELDARGKEVLRALLQDHFKLREADDVEDLPANAEGVVQTHRRPAEGRTLVSIFGPVTASRVGFTSRGGKTLYPADAALNMPLTQFSSGVQKRVLSSTATTSFDRSAAILQEHGGPAVAKRQLLEMARHGAQDFDEFYRQKSSQAAETSAQSQKLLVISTDAKGVVMRSEGLRDCTRVAAEAKVKVRDKRLRPGEKLQRKRMAQVAAVYDLDPWVRKPTDVVGDLRPVKDPTQKRPKPAFKRIWASVEKSADEVIETLFEEASKRDPHKDRVWVGLVDGNGPQMDSMAKYAAVHGVRVVMILDVIHMLEYLWKAVGCFCERGSKMAEEWVTNRYISILQGNVSQVAAGIRRSVTLRGLADNDRGPADKCADYLLKYKDMMRYDVYLAAGYPVGTGVIEGACRYLIKDRMDITGARWSLAGAEAILKLRAVQCSGDFSDYWAFHRQQEHARNHLSKYKDEKPPQLQTSAATSHLRLVK